MREYRTVLPDTDIYVYDNNSTDGTADIAKSAGAIVCHEYRQGKGNVIRSMFRDIEADCYLMIDGDDTFPAENAREMCDLVLSSRADMVVGDRLSSTYFTENKRRFHNFGNEIVRLFVNLLWRPKKPILDVMTGYRAFSPMFVKTFPILSEGFEIETEMTIHALDKNFKISTLPVAYRDRPKGSVSKLNTFSDGIKVLLTIFNLFREYKPMKFFGAAAIVLLVIGLGLFLPIFIHYLETGLVPRIPTLIVSTMFILMALLSVVCGLILETNAQNSRKNFEINMNIIAMLMKKR